jgi:hypothetical protein
MNRPFAALLCLTGFLILIQLWVFIIISEWLVDDSYAVIEFPKAHSQLYTPVLLGHAAGKFGGRYALIAMAVILFACFIRIFRKRNVNDLEL